MEFSYSQTENFEMEKLSSETGYFKKPVEINRGLDKFQTPHWAEDCHNCEGFSATTLKIWYIIYF